MTERVWTTRHGEKIPYDQLDDAHLANIILMLRRNAHRRKAAAEVRHLYRGNELPPSLDWEGMEYFFCATPRRYLEEVDPVYRSLMEEKEIRGLKAPLDEDGWKDQKESDALASALAIYLVVAVEKRRDNDA